MANITTLDLGVITPIPKGEYNSVTDYERLNFVTFNGSSWIRTEKEPYVVGSIPQTGSLYWQLNALGVSEIPDASLTVKGITKLSNATNSVDETVAATSRAVKSAYDIGSTAVSNATTANNTANSALSTANSTKAITDLVSLTAIAGGIPKADSTGKISDKWINIPAGKAIGELFPYTGIDVPAGSLPADGTTYTGFNTTYSDAYTWVTTKAKTKTLTEYTAIVNQYGECGFWGLDTATGTVRVPMIKSFIQGTSSVDEISKSVEAGLPSLSNVDIKIKNYNTIPGFQGGTMYSAGSTGASGAGSVFAEAHPYKLYLANIPTAYGKSKTVQPPSVKYRWFVQIYSAVLPASTADMANWNTQLDGRANTDLSNLEPAANNVIKSALNATGNAPIFACRAWVNFNGTGTVAIRASGNVSSITDNRSGDYTVNFTTAMPDANFATFIELDDSNNITSKVQNGTTVISYSVTNVRVLTGLINESGSSLKDCIAVFVSIFR